MTTASKIRELAAKGVKPADIARLLDVSRQAVHGALNRRDPGEAIYEGKDGCRITIRLTSELCQAIERAQRKDETRSACVVRLLEKGLGR
jgi:predicted transcriptional regulator